jgi:hypothetical protein
MPHSGISMTEERNPTSNPFSAAWGVLGVVGVLIFAVTRIAPIAMEAIAGELSFLHWFLLLANVVFMGWSEGYRGFQQNFSPRVAARALYIYRTPLPAGTLLLAPFFCVGFFHAARRVRLIAWIGSGGIVLLVFAVHQLSQPWRGILDAGVVFGLSWGLISLIYIVYQAFTSEHFDRSPELS